MPQRIEEMQPAQIHEFVTHYNKAYELGFTEITNELEFSDDELLEIITAINALVITGSLPNAKMIFSRLFNDATGELQRRMGALPYIEDDQN